MRASKQSREVNSRNFDVLFAGMSGVPPLETEQAPAATAISGTWVSPVTPQRSSAPTPKPHVPLRPAPSFTPVIKANPAPPMPQITAPPAALAPEGPDAPSAEADFEASAEPSVEIGVEPSAEASIEPSGESSAEVVAAAAADLNVLGTITLDDGITHNVEQKTTLGRNPAAPASERLVVDDPRRTMSKSHLQVRAAKGGITIVDLNSTNGTRVVSPAGISIKLRPNNPTFVELGSTVHFGGRSFTVTPGKENI